MNKLVDILFWSMIATLAAILLYATVTIADSHEAPSGKWVYPPECCSNNDCDVVIKHSDREGNMVMTTKMHGDVVVRGTEMSKVRPSQDEHWHICTPLGKPADGYNRTIFCIFAPGGV